MAAKLKLVAEPAFKAKVDIPIAGAAPASVEFSFKHRTKDQLDEFMKNMEGKTDLELTLDIVTGWDLEDEFTPANVAMLLQSYHRAAFAISSRYSEVLIQGKQGN